MHLQYQNIKVRDHAALFTVLIRCFPEVVGSPMDALPSCVALWQDGIHNGREVLGEAPLPARDELHS